MIPRKVARRLRLTLCGGPRETAAWRIEPIGREHDDLQGVPQPVDLAIAKRSGAVEAAAIDWQTPFSSVLDYTRPPFARWFVGGRTNLCHNAIDRHLATRGSQKALIYISTETGESRTYTLRGASRRGEPLCGRAEGRGRGSRRSRADLHADDRRGCVRDARVRARLAPSIRWCSADLPRRALRRGSTTRSRK